MTQIVGDYKLLPIAAFLEKLYPEALDELLAGGDQTLVTFDAGGTIGSCYGIESPSDQWENSSLYGVFSAHAKGRGVSYLSTLLGTPSPQFVTLGNRLLLTNGDVSYKSQESVALLPSPKAFGNAFKAVFGTRKAMLTNIMGSKWDCVRSWVRQNQKNYVSFVQPDAANRSRYASLVRMFGYQMAETHPVTVSWGGNTDDQRKYMNTIQAGVHYVYMSFRCSATDISGSRTIQYAIGDVNQEGVVSTAASEIVVPGWGASGSETIIVGIPVLPRSDNRAIIANWSTNGDDDPFSDVKWYTDIRAGTGGNPDSWEACFWPGASVYYAHAPTASSEVVGTPYPYGETTQGMGTITSSLWATGNPQSQKVAFLPLIAPPGGVLYHIEMASADVGEPLLIGELHGNKLFLRVVKGYPRKALYSLPATWYDAYLSTGFGIYKPLTGEELQKAKDAAVDLAGKSLQISVPAAPYGVPADVVYRTDIYKTYKKAREKACKLNNFMELEFAAGVKWGAVDSHFAKLPNGISAMYALNPGSPTGSATMPTRIGDYTKLTLTGAKTGSAAEGTQVLTITQSGTPEIDVTDSGSVAEAIMGGAKLVGFTVADLDITWPGYAAAHVETTAANAEINEQVANRGMPSSTLDFSWESIGISGYPVYDEMPVQSAYKCAIASEILYSVVGAQLYKAIQSFDLAHITAIVSKD